MPLLDAFELEERLRRRRLAARGIERRAGQRIKNAWTLTSLLGVGSVASVYAAVHRNGEHAALRILHGDLAGDPRVREVFLREAYRTNKVEHPAMVLVRDDDVTERGEPFLVMDLLEGETLQDRWTTVGRRMSQAEVMPACERALDCLAACHDLGLFHRDLKPTRVFVTSRGEVKLLGFGAARTRDAVQVWGPTGVALGTPAYMSPEAAMGLVDQLDGRADLFSVGAMMHALLTGYPINDARTEADALVMAATRPVPSVARIAPQLPPALVAIVDRSLAWDRRQRYADARAMRAAILEVMTAPSTRTE